MAASQGLKTGKFNLISLTKNEYHVAIEIDKEANANFYNELILRTADDDSYIQKVSLDDSTRVIEEKVDDINFKIVKFFNVIPGKYYHCFFNLGIKVRGERDTPEGVFYLFQNLLIDPNEDDIDEGDEDIVEESGNEDDSSDE